MTLATCKDRCVDATDAARMGRFWADLLRLGLDGATVLDPDSHRWTVRRDPEGGEPCVFAPVPEPKTVENRIDLDVATSDFEALMAATSGRD